MTTTSNLARFIGAAAALGIGALFAASALAPFVHAQTSAGGIDSGGIGSPTSAGGINVPPTQPNQNITLYNPLGAGTNLEQFIQDILALVIRIGSIVIIFMLVYVGYLFVTAGGEPGKISEARKALQWTVIGALILLGAQAIASGIQATVQAISQGH